MSTIIKADGPGQNLHKDEVCTALNEASQQALPSSVPTVQSSVLPSHQCSIFILLHAYPYLLMKASMFSTKVALAALLVSQVNAGPVIKPRGQGWGIALEIIKLFADIFKAGGSAFPGKVDA